MLLPGSIAAPNLYPFKDGYGIYSGKCPSADPRQAPTYPTGDAGTAPYILNVGPGQSYGTLPSLPVFEPAINVHVYASDGTAITDGYKTTQTGPTTPAAPATNAGTMVTVKPTDSSCGTFPAQAVGTNPQVLPTFYAPAPAGQISYPGYPFGTYTVCARDNAGHRGFYTGNGGIVSNTDFDGTGLINITMGTTPNQPACPS
jgi:hypothetical protein